MARKSGSTISQEELYPVSHEPGAEELDDARLLDLDAEQDSPFLRGQKRVSVRRGSLPKKTAARLTWTAVLAVVMFACAAAVAALYHYGEHSWRFRIDSSDKIEISGLQNVTRPQVMEVLGGDIGRNIFFIPLSQRQQQLDQIPWVESASVMRFVPNRLRIEIHERTPIAFARVGSRICLVDAEGSLMDLPVGTKKKFSFPVILGMNQGEPRTTRAARMKIYNDMVGELDSSGGHYSQDLSEVDLSDADDVKVLANDPGGVALIHLGSSNYLERYKIYVGHVREWRQQFAKLDSVDLRYDRQIVVNPDLQGTAPQPPLAAPVTRAAMAAGVKPAALIGHEGSVAKQGTVSSTAGLKPIAVKKQALRARHKKAVVRKASSKAATSANSAQATGQVSSGVAKDSVKQSPTAAPSKNVALPASKPSPAIPKGQGQQ